MAKGKSIERMTDDELHAALAKRAADRVLKAQEQLVTLDQQIMELTLRRRDLIRAGQVRNFRLSDAYLEELWKHYSKRFLKPDRVTVNISEMARVLDVDYTTLLFWVKSNHSGSVSHSVVGHMGCTSERT